MKFEDIQQNTLCHYEGHNLYLFKQGRVIKLYRRDNNDNFILFSSEKEFKELSVLCMSEYISSDEEYADKGDEINEIDKQFKKLEEKLYGHSIDYSNKYYCYILIQYNDGNSLIKDIISQRIVVDNFDVKYYYNVTSYKLDSLDHDCYIRLWNSSSKCIAFLSLFYGYILPPYYYEKIECYENSVILDDIYLVDYEEISRIEERNRIIDISDCEKIKCSYDIIYSKKKKLCYIKIKNTRNRNYEYSLVRLYLESNDSIDDKIEDIENSQEKYSREIDYIKYTFDAKNKKLDSDFLDYFDKEWTEEDSWDVITEGMYGDMPGNPSDYDKMMDAMGF